MAKLKEYNGYYCESEFEYAFLAFLEAEGWQYLSGNKINRPTKRDVLIADDFKLFISKTNADLTDDEANQKYHKNPNTLCSSYSVMIEFEEKHPDIAKEYYDLRYEDIEKEV